MRKHITLVLILTMIFTLFSNTIFIDESNIVEASVQKVSGKYEVTAKNLNIRTGSGTKYKKVGTLKKVRL